MISVSIPHEYDPAIKEVLSMEKLWKDEFRQIEFEFEDRYATLIFPPEDVKTSHWMLKTEYFGAFPALEMQLLRRGYHLAYLKNVNRIGTDIDTDAKMRFAKYLQENYGLSEKCVPIGMSCGGLQAVNFAAKYPDAVSVLYLDAPVMNFLSWPFGMGDCFVNRGEEQYKEVLDALGMTRSELICFRGHPIDKIPTLVERRIPVVMVYGDSDTVVPYPENGYVLEKAYRQANIPLAVFGKAGCEHHPHGLADSAPIIDFILKHDQ
jgi:pimeloyl-ACP methyl ester carboxylesterase